jgi:putative flavoprotein involved in K+ transport
MNTRWARRVRSKPHPHISRRDGGHTIDLRDLALAGIHLHGRLLGAGAGTAQFKSDLSRRLRRADMACEKFMEEVDEKIEELGLDAPPDDTPRHDWEPHDDTSTLDLDAAGVRTVVWATGYHHDYSWIDLPIFDDTGYPRYERGVTETDGFYFIGLHWLHSWGSGLFYGMGEDAQFVADHIASRR